MVAGVPNPKSLSVETVRPASGERPAGAAGEPVRREAVFESLLKQALVTGPGVASGVVQNPGALAQTLMERLQIRATDRLLRLLSGEEAGEVREPDGRMLEQLLEWSARAVPAAEPLPVPKAAPDLPRTDVPGKRTGRAGSAELSPIIEKAARRYGVDPLLVRCVIRAESGFRPDSTSPKGAMGLMQLMPGTARDLGVTNAYDPEQNVVAGTRYLKSLLDRYDGNLSKALAAYNWGMGNVDRRPDRLPEETRRYVSGILRDYQKVSA